MKSWQFALAAALLGGALAASDVEAARLGGGRAVGMQRSITNAPPARAPARQAQQAAPAQQQSAAAAPQAGTAASAGASRWMPILGGLALGGLLGYLMSGSGLGAILLLAAVAIGAMFLVRALARSRAGAIAQPVQYAGIGNETVAAPPPSQAAGLDSREEPVARAASVPPGFDVAGFLRAAKLNFVKLQIANDAGNLGELREVTTAQMYEELSRDVAARGAAGQQTDVVALNADLLEIATEGDRYWASVRFSGMIRETPGTAPSGFEEVWNLVKPVDGSTGWLLAGIQQMH
jgi:predicted lipid-binding transport protein (Tim44 family)